MIAKYRNSKPKAKFFVAEMAPKWQGKLFFARLLSDQKRGSFPIFSWHRAADWPAPRAYTQSGRSKQFFRRHIAHPSSHPDTRTPTHPPTHTPIHAPSTHTDSRVQEAQTHKGILQICAQLIANNSFVVCRQSEGEGTTRWGILWHFDLIFVKRLRVSFPLMPLSSHSPFPPPVSAQQLLGF